MNKAKCERNCGFEGNGKELRDHNCVNYLKNIITRLQQDYSSERLAKVSLKEDHGECQKTIDSLTKEIQDLRQQLEKCKGAEQKVLPSPIARINKEQKFFESVAKSENEKLVKENRELRERIDRIANGNNEKLVRENRELQEKVASNEEIIKELSELKIDAKNNFEADVTDEYKREKMSEKASLKVLC